VGAVRARWAWAVRSSEHPTAEQHAMADRELQALERGGTCESTGDRCDEVCGWSVERVVVVVVVVSGHGSHHHVVV
jgi:hypothetical protein